MLIRGSFSPFGTLVVFFTDHQFIIRFIAFSLRNTVHFTQMLLPTTIDHLGIDLLENILARLPAVDFASANGTCSLWHYVCGLVLCRPKLFCACSHNPSLQVAVEEVVNEVLTEPMRPHFAIVSIRHGFHFDEAKELITAKLGSNFPILINRSTEFMGRDVSSEEFKEDSANAGIMLVVGFLPGMEVKTIPLFTRSDDRYPRDAMIDKFITGIKEFSTSISGCNSPAAIIMFVHPGVLNIKALMEKLDCDMSPQTVIVGYIGCFFVPPLTVEGMSVAAVALVFVKDMSKPLGIGETQFHSVLSSGMLPLGPIYEVTSCKYEVRHYIGSTTDLAWITASREGSHENISGEVIMSLAYEEGKNHGSFSWLAARGGRLHYDCLRQWYIGVTKKRKRCNGLVTSFAFHPVECGYWNQMLCVDGLGLETGDTFRFYLPDSKTALSSADNVSNHLSSFKQGSTSSGDKREVVGGLVFTSCRLKELFFGQPSVDSSSFMDNFPGVPLGVTICDEIIGRGNLTMYVKESQEVFTCVNKCGSAFLIMSYAP